MVLSQIRKRDGKIVLFNKQKIVNAIYKAIVASGSNDRNSAERLADKVVEIVESKYSDNNVPNVEYVQDVVERILIEEGHTTIAKGYILYREKRREAREAKDTLLDIEKTMGEYLQRSDWRVNENANVDFSLGGLILYISGKITANYWLNNIYNKEIRNAHINGDFHLHDLSMFSAYCAGWSLRQLILEGFGGVPNRLQTVPARHFDTINGQMVNFLGTLQNEWAGAQAFSFSPETPIIIKRNKKIETLTLEKLYEEYSHHEKKFNKFNSIFTQNIYRKYSIDDSKQHKYMDNRLPTEPILFQYDNIEVLSKNGFIPLKAITKHKSKEKNDKLLQIETEDGRILSVSGSHPMILKNKIKNIRADKLKIGDELILGDISNLFDYNYDKIKLDKDFAWLIGILIAEGCWGHQTKEYTIVSQKRNKPLRNKIEQLLKKLKIHYRENGEFNIVFGTTSMGRFIRNHLKLQNKCFRKNFPEFIYQLDYESLGAILSGYIDGDGENERNKQIRIHTTSLTLVTQLKDILDCLNINSTIRLSNPAKNSKYDCYCMRFKVNEDKLFLFEESLKLNKINGKKKESPKFSTKITKIRKAIYQPEYLYDITTETNDFLVCGLLVHNSSFDTYLAPFVRHDKLDYKQVKQQMQRFMFNIATPSRWGTQCVPIDTEALTDKGWKKYNEIKDEKIATFDIKTKKIEYLKPSKITAYNFDGYLINLKNRTQNQLVTPDHKVVRKRFSSNQFELIEAEKLMNYKTPIQIPTAWKTSNKKEIDDNLVKLFAWLVSEGSFSDGERNRVYLFQSKKNEKNCNEIRKILKELNFKWDESEKTGGFSKIKTIRFRLNQGSSRQIRKYLEKKKIPSIIKNLSARQIKLFIETYIKGDGCKEKNGRIRIYTKDKDVKDSIQELCAISGFGTTILQRKNEVYTINLIRNNITNITSITKYKYKGKVWCPTTRNGTFIARRNGKVFITGNTPFINTTLDWIVPEDLANQPAIIGGKPQSYTYGDCQEEMDMVNKAFIECMVEGDASKRVFTFPIPTYNITREFDWGTENSDLLFDMTAKYGIPYFQNFINSSLKPSDVRSMCLHHDEEIIVKINGKIKRIKIEELVEKYSEEFDEDGWSKNNYDIEAISINPETFNAEWVKIKNFLKKRHNKLITIFNKGGKRIRVSANHLIPIIENGRINYKFSQDIKEEDVMLISRNSSSLLNQEKITINNYLLDEDLVKIFGFFLAEGNYLKDSRKRWYGRIRGLQFTFHKDEEKYINELFKLIKKKFGYESKIRDDPRYPTKYLYVYNTKLAKDFYNIMDGRSIPEEIFNSPKSVIKTFLDYFFKGDGYKDGSEIHMNNLPLSRDLVLLYNLIDIPTTYIEKENSQLIRLQHTNGRGSREILYNLIPIELINIEEVHGARRACVRKNKFVGKNLLKKYGGYDKVKNYFEKDIALSPVTAVVHKDLDCEQMFYDIELEKNHIFIHSLGTITHNCCRLQLDLRELRNKGGGGLFGAGENTGSVGVVTINMPRIGYLAGTENEFLERVGYLMEIAKQSLEVKRKVISQKMEQGLLPYTKRYLGNLNHHFSTIGLIGMNEACLNLFGENIATKRGREFSLMILEFMREKLTKFQEETKNIYNLEATPGEGSLAPEEKVLISQSNPKFIEIGPLVDKYLEKNKENIQLIENSEVLKIPEGEMFSYGFSKKNQKIGKYPVTALIRHQGKSMYEITTVSGRKIKVTGQHSVFGLSSEGEPQEILVKELRVGSSIAIPKKIEMEEINKEFNLIQIFKDSSFKNKLYGIFPLEFIEKLINNLKTKEWCDSYYKYSWRDIKFNWRKRKIIPLKLIYDLKIDINKKILESSKVFYRLKKNTKPIKAIISINKNFGFVIGGLLSEGWISERSQFTNTDKKTIKKFFSAVEETFGKGSAHLSSKNRSNNGRKTLYTICLSKIIGYFLNEINIRGKSYEKKIPEFLFFSPLNAIQGLLEGFHLGDGSFYKNKKKNDFSVRLYTNSKELIEGLNLCLLRFGILAKIRKDKKSRYNYRWKDNYFLSISGVDNLKKYFSFIPNKKIMLNNVHSGREIIPEVPRSIKTIMKKYSIKSCDMGIHKDSLNRNIRINRISIQFLKKIIKKLSYLKDEKIKKLRLLINSDIYWDKIKEIKKTPTPRFVYDLEVDVENGLVNNFLGGEGLICLHNTSYRLAKIDKHKFPDIITAGKNEPYYTNSTILPVNYTDDVFEALELQDELQTKYTGGTVVHCFIGERLSDAEATKKLVRKIAYNFRLPYYTITPTFSICQQHGYIKGEVYKCPQCNTNTEVYSRVVGYLRPVQQWNKGKKEEFSERKTYDYDKSIKHEVSEEALSKIKIQRTLN